MPKFDVHIFAVVRVKVEGVEAEDKYDAVRRTEEIDLYPMFNWLPKGTDSSGLDVAYTEFAEEVRGYIVDPILKSGRVDYDRSCFIENDVQYMEMKRRGVY